MPNENIDIETDGNPETIYEDTTEHESTGYTAENSKQIQHEDLNEPIDEIEI
ncbi:hypothetical protein [Paenibacillus piri]|uniref:hypothetical protein n=1 Tax=Paenibacillus piri TaxID=2547395 RepID=UPI00140478A9|nr:hypothetical protein [Paenibacillus piri]